MLLATLAQIQEVYNGLALSNHILFHKKIKLCIISLYTFYYKADFF